MKNPLFPKSEENSFSTEISAPSGGPYKIALLCGGISNEREVSLSGADNVEKALTSAGHEVIRIDTADPDSFTMLQQIKPEVAFIALHGKGGEDGRMQAALEALDIPYTGSGVLGSALAMDKHRSKIIYEAITLNTAPWLYLRERYRDAPFASPEQIVEKMGLPVVVKPADAGSSVGTTIVRESKALPKALADAFAAGTDVLVEKYIDGTEITISVLGSSEPTPLPAIEIIPKNEFYDYESKYSDQGSVHIIPARVSSQVLEKANRTAVMAHEALDCFGVSRTDMIVDKEDNIWIIETNTIPGMTGTSLLPDAAAHAGIDNQMLYELLIEYALERAEAEKE